MTETAKTRFLNPSALARPPGYSQVIDVHSSRMIFIAGQASSDAEGNIIGAGDFAVQAEQAFGNLSAALASAGCTAANLVKLTVYLRDVRRLAEYRQARDKFFQTVDPPAAPAITLIEVSSLFDAKLLIEIEGIAAA
jgi:enamine deaminase RidA (YjgF/YER057c/UK114 family)